MFIIIIIIIYLRPYYITLPKIQQLTRGLKKKTASYVKFRKLLKDKIKAFKNIQQIFHKIAFKNIEKNFHKIGKYLWTRIFFML